MNALPSRLLAVTDRHQATEPLVACAASLFGAGVRWLWMRDRDLPVADRRALAVYLQKTTIRAGAALSIGGDVELARLVGAAGVHLRSAGEVAEARRRLGPAALIGVSAHSPADVTTAAHEGADYATLSPIFVTASKPGYGPALGLGALAAAARLGLPVLALGGVAPAQAGVCLKAGAAGVAVMGPLMRDGRLAVAANLTAALGLA